MREGQPCKELPGWTWYHWPSSREDNRYLQHDSGVVALSLFDAHKKAVFLPADAVCAQRKS